MKECELKVRLLPVITIKQHKNSERAVDVLTDFFANTAQLTFSNVILCGNAINLLRFRRKYPESQLVSLLNVKTLLKLQNYEF